MEYKAINIRLSNIPISISGVILDITLFNEILEHYKTGFTLGETWKSLAKKFGYPEQESLRSQFRRMRSKYHIASPDIKKVKVGIFDIETSPMQTYSFGLWKQDIRPEQIVKDSYIICWSAKYLNNAKIYSDIVTSEESLHQDDIRIVLSLYDYLNTCDIVIGQNIKNFDIKKLNTRLLYHNIKPLSRFAVVDTLQIARSCFDFPSNSLKYMNKFLDIKQKQSHEGFNLWIKCMNGDDESLKIMQNYCNNDVLATEDLYYKLLPFIPKHPNLSLYFESDDINCPRCMGKLLVTNKHWVTPSGKYVEVRCEKCGGIGRQKQNLVPKDRRQNIIVS